MALTPTRGAPLPQVSTQAVREQTWRTYRMDLQQGRVVGMVDGLDAMRQAIYKILSTPRFAHLIYSWRYGIELERVLGKSGRSQEGELQRVITEALLADSRITQVKNMTFRQPARRVVAVAFTAVTTLGELEIEREVAV